MKVSLTFTSPINNTASFNSANHGLSSCTFISVGQWDRKLEVGKCNSNISCSVIFILNINGNRSFLGICANVHRSPLCNIYLKCKIAKLINADSNWLLLLLFSLQIYRPNQFLVIMVKVHVINQKFPTTVLWHRSVQWKVYRCATLVTHE